MSSDHSNSPYTLDSQDEQKGEEDTAASDIKEIKLAMPTSPEGRFHQK